MTRGFVPPEQPHDVRIERWLDCCSFIRRISRKTRCMLTGLPIVDHEEVCSSVEKEGQLSYE